MHRAHYLIAIAVVAAAGRLAAQGRGPTIRDSAGIHIVENVTPVWTAQTARRVDPKPVLTLGAGGGGPEEEFGAIQGAVRLSDGSVVVADRKSSELRIFNAAGKFIRRIGQKGEGPGDFNLLVGVFRLPGDSILTYDMRLHRLTWFTPDGKARRTLAVAQPPIVTFPGGQRMGSSLDVLGTLQDGTVLGYHGNGRMNPPTAIFSDSLHASHVTADGKLNAIATLFRGKTYSYNSADNKLSTGGDLPFTTKSSVAAGGKSLWYTDGVHYEIREYDLGGKVLRMIRVRRTATSITAGEIATFKAKEMDEERSQKMNDESYRQQFVDLRKAIHSWIPFPTSMPAFTALLIDPSGAPWAREYGDSTKAQHWDSFDRTGRLLGVVDVPAGLDVLEIGADYILGRMRDQDDVESVRLYRFVH